MLRAIQAGLRLEDLNRLSYGRVMGIMFENMNDDYDYPRIGSPADVGGIIHGNRNKD